MAATNKFKNWMAAKLGSILRREITPDEITLGPSTAATGTKTALVEITYNGEKHVVVYDKYPISELFAGGVAPVAIAGEITSIAQALPLLNARYGLDLKDTDVVQATFDKNTVNIAFEITPSCYEYTGKLLVPFTWTGPVDLETPLHEWMLQNNLENTGQSKIALAGNITLASDANGKWGRLGTLAHIPLPSAAILSRPADYTLDFEVAVTAIPTYMCLLSTSATVAGAPGSMWWYGGRFYEYGVSSGTDSRVPLMKANTPQRITLVRKAGKTSMYIDGVFIIEYVGGNNSPLIGFHDGDSPNYQFPTSGGLRKLRFWQKALSAPELVELFKTPAPTPTHKFLLDGNDTNTGTSTTPLGMALTYETIGGKVYGKRTKPGGEKLSTVFKLGGDYVLDMVLYPTTLPYKSVLFAPSSGVPDDPYYGSIMFFNGKFYHAHMSTLGTPLENRPALNLNSPNRLVIRKQGNVMSVYLNQTLITTHASTAIKDYDTFGYAGYDAWHQGNLMRAVRFWEGTVSDKEFASIMANSI